MNLPETTPNTDTLRQMYLDLLKRSLLNLIYFDNELRLIYLQQVIKNKQPIDPGILRDIRYRTQNYADLLSLRTAGRNFSGQIPQFSHSLIGLPRMENIQHCAEIIFKEKIPGDFMETGVWQGGATIFMRALLKVYGEDIDRCVWAADSFEGLPKPQVPQDETYDLSASKFPFLAIGLEAVRDNFRTYNLLDDCVKFLKGWFEETLPNAPIKRLALLRLDGDLYKSTLDALNPLYDKVSPGGFIIIDDYYAFEPCKQAVDEFRASRNIIEPMTEIDWTGVFWRKSY
ncbi:MAG TPA: class I SAM-dependent methyltransferase [Oscillatoriales cyanobacterium M59_W2019_021]|nr:MAG: macrocin O-methyltransferase [Cyanobacteria bacterium J055]HIK29942.1 class I SAM-dependent methyltransferase [Oscillatoriales cyanobacterium M4454_W2019_049]HIK50188.1 class I SAM-dependent methyltransferase [Oscillatoriales cyanobacterium M59_W2019_021]